MSRKRYSIGEKTKHVVCSYSMGVPQYCRKSGVPCRKSIYRWRKSFECGAFEPRGR